MSVRVAINGFGRIGRNVLRAIAESGRKDIEVVGINDLGPVETNAHLLRYDSVHGRFPKDVKVDGDSISIGGGAKIKVAAERAMRKGTVLDLPHGVYEEFAARFPYEETEDQLAAIEAVLTDMASGRPMDRLLCGDVGFGKTEVALRAAFVAAMSGKQVALLAPTTLLVRQHYRVFVQRFEGLPVRVASLSRFVTAKEASEGDYDGLVLPGGVANPDFLRADEDAVGFVRSFFEARKPVAVICHGPWTLVEADVVRGRTLTSWPSLKTDIRNAGGEWVDEEVHVDRGLVTSRKPADLPAFCAKAIEEFAEGRHAGRSQEGARQPQRPSA